MWRGITRDFPSATWHTFEMLRNWKSVWPSVKTAFRGCKLYRMESSTSGAAIDRASHSPDKIDQLLTPALKNPESSQAQDAPQASASGHQSAEGATAASRYAGDKGYEYLQRGFSTEMFKIEIGNMPPKMGYSVSVTTCVSAVCYPCEIIINIGY